MAAAGKDGERWLAEEPENPEYPEPALEEISEAAPQLWLYCFGGRKLTLNGVVGVPAPLSGMYVTGIATHECRIVFVVTSWD